MNLVALMLILCSTLAKAQYCRPIYYKEFQELLNEKKGSFGNMLNSILSICTPGGEYDQFHQAMVNPTPDADEDPFLFNRTIEFNDVIKYIEKMDSMINSDMDILENLEFFTKNVRKLFRLNVRFGRFVNTILKNNGNWTPEEKKAVKLIQDGILDKFERLSNETKCGNDHRIRLSTYNEKIRSRLETVLKDLDKVLKSKPEQREIPLRDFRYHCETAYKHNLPKNFDFLFRQTCPIRRRWRRTSRSSGVANIRGKRALQSFFEIDSDLYGFNTFHASDHECSLSSVVRDVQDRMTLIDATLEELFIDLLRTSFVVGTCQSVLNKPPGFFDRSSSRLKNVTLHTVEWIKDYQTRTWPNLGEQYAKEQLNEAFAGRPKIHGVFYEMAARIIAQEFEDREIGGYEYQVVVTPPFWGEVYASARSFEDGYYHAIKDFMGITAHIFKFKGDSALSRMHNASLWFEEMKEDVYRQIESKYLFRNSGRLMDQLPLSDLIKIDGYHGILLLRNKRFFAEDAYIPHGVSYKEMNGTKNAMNVYVWIVGIFSVCTSIAAQTSVHIFDGTSNSTNEPDDENALLYEQPVDINDVIKYIRKFTFLAESEKNPLEKIDDFSKNLEELHRLHVRLGSFVNDMLKNNGSQTPDEANATKLILRDILGKFEKQESDHPRRLKFWSYHEKIRSRLGTVLMKIDQMIRSPLNLREEAVEHLRNECRRHVMENVTNQFELLFRDACPMPTKEKMYFYAKVSVSRDKSKLRGMDSYLDNDPFHDNMTESGRTHCAISTLFKDVDNRISLVNPALEELFFDLLRTYFVMGSCESFLENSSGSLNSLTERLSNVTSHIVEWTKTFQKMAWPYLGQHYASRKLMETFSEPIDPFFFNRTAEMIAAEFEDREINGYQYQVVVTREVPLLSSDMISAAETLEEDNYARIRSFMGIDAHVFKFRSDPMPIMCNTSMLFENMRKRINRRLNKGLSMGSYLLRLSLQDRLKTDGYHGILYVRNQKFFASDAHIPYGISYKEVNGTKAVSVKRSWYNPRLSDAVHSIVFQFL